MRSALRGAGEPSPIRLLGKAIKTAPKLNEPGEDLKRLFEVAKKQTVKFSELCDKLDMSPARVKKLIDDAWAFGIPVKVAHDHVGISLPTPDDRIKFTGIAPVVGKRQMLGVITDTHLGSKYCLREQLKEFINHAYDQGVREILHVGDVLDGDYRHGKFEMTHMGIEEQTRDLFEVLPQRPGLTYHGITGNHDFTFTEESGVNVGRYISNYFAERGRKDIKFYGDRGAFLKIRGAVIHLWHPSGGVSYAVSYRMQKKIESYSPGQKPHVMLVGHWHRYCNITERGVHGVACGTFQGGGSAFSKSLTSGAPAIGGTILSFDMTADGTMRSFIIERRNYFEVETPDRVDTDEGIAVVKSRKR